MRDPYEPQRYPRIASRTQLWSEENLLEPLRLDQREFMLTTYEGPPYLNTPVMDELFSPIKDSDPPEVKQRKTEARNEYLRRRIMYVEEKSKRQSFRWKDIMIQRHSKRVLDREIERLKELLREHPDWDNLRPQLADAEKERRELDRERERLDRENEEKAETRNEETKLLETNIVSRLRNGRNISLETKEGGQGSVYQIKRPIRKRGAEKWDADFVAKIGKAGTLWREKLFLRRFENDRHTNIVLGYTSINIGLENQELEVILMQKASRGSLDEFAEYYPFKESEYKAGQTEAHLWPFPEKEIWELFIDYLAGLAYLHTGRNLDRVGNENPQSWSPIRHNDIKPLNLLVHFDQALNRHRGIICDFGASDFHPHDFRDTYPSKMITWTTGYVPPEYPNITVGFDIWGLGVSLHKVLTSYYPQDNRSWYNPERRNLLKTEYNNNRETILLWPYQPVVILDVSQDWDADRRRYHTEDEVKYSQNPIITRSRALSYHLHRMLGKSSYYLSDVEGYENGVERQLPDANADPEIVKRPDATTLLNEMQSDFRTILQIAKARNDQNNEDENDEDEINEDPALKDFDDAVANFNERDAQLQELKAWHDRRRTPPNVQTIHRLTLTLSARIPDYEELDPDLQLKEWYHRRMLGTVMGPILSLFRESKISTEGFRGLMDVVWSLPFTERWRETVLGEIWSELDFNRSWSPPIEPPPPERGRARQSSPVFVPASPPGRSRSTHNPGRCYDPTSPSYGPSHSPTGEP
jgi:serine/threonine protein kinase